MLGSVCSASVSFKYNMTRPVKRVRSEKKTRAKLFLSPLPVSTFDESLSKASTMATTVENEMTSTLKHAEAQSAHMTKPTVTVGLPNRTLATSTK